MKNRLLITIIIIIVGGVLGNILRYTEKTPDRQADYSNIPYETATFTGVEQKIEDYASEILQADNTIKRQYHSHSGQGINFYSAYFKSQKYGAQIHSPKHCLPGGGWKIDKLEPYEMKIKDGSTKMVNLMHVSLENYKAVMFYWFETRSGSVREEFGLKFSLIINSLLFRPTDASIVRVTVDVTGNDFESATNTGVEFYNEIHHHLTEALPF